ncbi:MAG: hypothetical protein PGN15_07550 [Aeromicrobium erythreum]
MGQPRRAASLRRAAAPDTPEAHDAIARYAAVLARVAGALAEGSTSLPEVETSRAGHVG